MTKNLSEMFMESNGQPIEHDGQRIVQIVSIDVTDDTTIRIRRIKHKVDIVQGVRVKIKTGALVLDGNKYKDIVLWADNSPEDVTLVCKTKGNTVVKIWNTWKYENVMQAWIGNSGMIVDRKGNEFTLSCSDGTNNPAFADIVYKLEVN